jgi:hypothetical protein
MSVTPAMGAKKTLLSIFTFPIFKINPLIRKIFTMIYTVCTLLEPSILYQYFQNSVKIFENYK